MNDWGLGLSLVLPFPLDTDGGSGTGIAPQHSGALESKALSCAATVGPRLAAPAGARRLLHERRRCAARRTSARPTRAVRKRRKRLPVASHPTVCPGGCPVARAGAKRAVYGVSGMFRKLPGERPGSAEKEEPRGRMAPGFLV